MRAKIKAKKTGNGRYTMIAILPNGEVEYPQEGYEYDKKSEVFSAAYEMYGRTKCWDYKNHTIKID